MLLALESGEKAADYIFEQYPDLFPMREPVPVKYLSILIFPIVFITLACSHFVFI